jgi:hypothetical protein
MEAEVLREVTGRGSLVGGEPRGGEYTGLKALMMAVLEDGIRDYREGRGRLSAEAAEWIRSDRRDAFSFIVICETLGLEPAAVRAALARPRRAPPT